MNKSLLTAFIVLIAFSMLWYFTRTEQAQSPSAIPLVAEASEVTFDITGVDFAFDLTEITVNEGDVVTINFESSLGFHDWVIDEFSASTKQVRPGTPTSVTFVAGSAGTYEYYCSVGNHRDMGMVGALTVLPN